MEVVQAVIRLANGSEDSRGPVPESSNGKQDWNASNVIHDEENQLDGVWLDLRARWCEGVED